MNKAIILAILSLAISTNKVPAQNSKAAETLLGNGQNLQITDIGFFIAPKLGITQMDRSAAWLFNLRGGITIKDKVSVGAFFSTSLNQIQPKSETIPFVYMDYWTVGGFAEYTVLAKKLVHLSIPVYVGYGEVQMDNETGAAGLGEANFLQLEPAAMAELNINKHIRLNAGVGYRFVGPMTYRNFNESALSGLTGYVGLKLGLFR